MKGGETMISILYYLLLLVLCWGPNENDLFKVSLEMSSFTTLVTMV